MWFRFFALPPKLVFFRQVLPSFIALLLCHSAFAMPSCQLSGEYNSWSYFMYPLGSSDSTETMKERVVLVLDATNTGTNLEHEGVPGFSKSGRLYTSSRGWETVVYTLPIPLKFASDKPVFQNSAWRQALASTKITMTFELSDGRGFRDSGFNSHDVKLGIDITGLAKSSDSITISGVSDDGLLRFSETFEMRDVVESLNRIQAISEKYVNDLVRHRSCKNKDGAVRVLIE